MAAAEDTCYSDLEKTRFYLKYKHEGFLKGMMGYGFPKKMYDMFPDLEIVYHIIENHNRKNTYYTEKQILFLKKLSKQIENYLTDVKDINYKYTDKELESVNYIFD